MIRTLLSTTLMFVALVACTKQADDSPALQRAKDDTNAAVDSARSAVGNAADAARDAAREAAERARPAHPGRTTPRTRASSMRRRRPATPPIARR